MPDGDQRLRVLVADQQGRPVAARGLAAWLQKVAPRRARGVVHIALVSDVCVRTLNRTFRGKDAATDVLSFPAEPALHSKSARNRRGRGAHNLLGDIVIARGVAHRQARDAGHAEATELKVLALHGLLHLLGYDHEHDNGRMRSTERRLRRLGGLPGGLIERADR